MTRHHILARTYEALGLWHEAAREYRKILEAFRSRLVRSSPNSAERVLNEFRLARVYEKLGDTDRARHWYERFTEDWKDADPDIPELIEARERLGELKAEEVAAQ